MMRSTEYQAPNSRIRRIAAAEAIAQRPLPFALAPGTVVSGFMPLKSEINPVPLLRKLSDKGARLALPVVAGRGKPLVMRAFAFGDALQSGPKVGDGVPRPFNPLNVTGKFAGNKQCLV